MYNMFKIAVILGLIVTYFHGNKDISFVEISSTPEIDKGVVVLNFWATWCGPCIRELPDFEQVHKEMGEKVLFYGAEVDSSDDKIKSAVAKAGVTYKVGRASKELNRRFGPISGIPATFILKDGKVMNKFVGGISSKILSAELKKHL